jgi:hypothetical protein
MLGILFILVIVMLALIWRRDGWKKALVIIGLWLASLFLTLFITAIVYGPALEVESPNIIFLIFFAIWAGGLIIYNAAKIKRK